VPIRALVGCLLVLACGAAPTVAAAERRSLFVNGDSLAVGTRPYLPGALPGWSIRTSASVSRHADEGAERLRSLGAALPRVIAVSLGTNDDPRDTATFARAIEDTMAIAGPDRCVVWATVRRPPVAGTSYRAYNRMLNAQARERPNLEVVRWDELVRAHPGWLAADGVHVNAAGYRARARAFARTIRRCP
jgi:lysophospholipase L1-like esterase